jgi:CheY-like chemotaxis protein
MRVLLIEDNLKLVQTLTQSLGVLGIQVEAEGDGVLADAALQQHGFDVVVLDLALPRMGGIEILRRMRNRGDKVPVLVLTATGDTSDRVHGLNAGADDYLPKPFDLSELEARLRALHRRNLGAVHSVLRVGSLEYDNGNTSDNSTSGKVFRVSPELRMNFGSMVGPNFFAQGGVGLYNVSFNMEDSIVGDLDDSSSEFGFNVGAGVGFPVGPKTRMNVQGQYHSVATEGESTNYLAFRAGIGIGL